MSAKDTIQLHVNSASILMMRSDVNNAEFAVLSDRDIENRRSSMRWFLDLSAIACVTISSHLILRLPLRRTPMYGDDYLGVRVAMMPIRSGTFFENIWLVGGGKWRPVTTSLLLFLGQKWEYSYVPFQILNSVLLITVAMLAGFICLRLTSALLPSVLTSAAVISSQFNWFAQISIYGSMELLAILFLLGSVAVFVSSRDAKLGLKTRVNLSVLSLLFASLCHERYILSSLVFVGFLIILQQRTQDSIGVWKPLLVPAAHVVLKGFVLDLDPLTGGGESNFRQSAGPWILSHFLDSAKMLSGWFSGAGHFYNGDKLGVLAREDSFGWIGSAVIGTAALVTVITIVWGLGSVDRRIRTLSLLEFPLMLIGQVMVCLIPAAMVVQRIEARWIFASQILLLIASSTSVCLVIKNRAVVAASLLPAAFLGIGIAYLPSSDSYTILRDQPTAVLEELQTRAPLTGPWSLVITQSDRNVSTAWQFGYGDALSQLPNPPYFVNISPDPHADCVREKSEMPCLRVTLKGLDTVGEVREEDSLPFNRWR